MNKTSKSIFNKGILESFSSVIPYSLIPLIFLIDFNKSSNFQNAFLKGSVLTEGKDFASTFIYILMVVISRKSKESLSLWNQKATFLVAISSVMGGPLGYTAYNTAFYIAGPSFGHIFTSLQPVFLAAFAVLYLKRKFKWQMWLGIILSVAATISIVAGGTLTMKNSQNMVIGAMLGILGALCWSLESMLMDKAITLYGKEDITPLLVWKMFYAMIFNFLFMFPIAGSLIGDPSKGYKYFGEFFTNLNYLWRFLLAGFLIFLGRYLIFNGMKHLGATYSNVIYGLTIITIPIFNLIYYGISGHYIGGEDVMNEQLTLKFQVVFWTLVPIMLVGATLVTIYKPNIDRVKEAEK